LKINLPIDAAAQTEFRAATALLGNDAQAMRNSLEMFLRDRMNKDMDNPDMKVKSLETNRLIFSY
jgi:hypothetical protein